MNGTMLSQIVWIMFLAHHCLPKVPKNCQKKSKVDFRVNYSRGSDNVTTVCFKKSYFNCRFSKRSKMKNFFKNPNYLLLLKYVLILKSSHLETVDM